METDVPSRKEMVMGYETSFHLSIEPGNHSGREIFEELRKNIDIRCALNISEPQAAYECRASCKWYSHDEDMLDVSRKFPNATFLLEGIGEDQGDQWKHHYRNGQILRQVLSTQAKGETLMNKTINKQWHPKPRVKIRRTFPYADSQMPTETYKLFKKGLVGKRTTWLYNSDITLEQAIASYCDFKPLLDKYPTIRNEGHEVSDQFDRIVVLHHYLNVLKIPQSKIEAALNDADRRCDIWFCTIS